MPNGSMRSASRLPIKRRLLVASFIWENPNLPGCLGITRKGKPCKRRSSKGARWEEPSSNFCHLHRSQAPEAA